MRVLVIMLLFGFSIDRTSLAETPPKNTARYDYYRLYYIKIITAEHLNLFKSIRERSDSYIFMENIRNLNQKTAVLVAAHKIAEFIDLCETFEIPHQLKINNFQEKIETQWKDVMPKDTNPQKLDWDHYFHLETLETWMESIVVNYHNVELIEIGKSVQGRPIKGLKLTKNKRKSTIFVESGIHAREWIGPATATYIINELLHSTDPTVKRIASDFNWIIFPVVNPDGYKYSFEGDRMWRKNRNLFGSWRGVDLNRNFPYHWNETGSSADPFQIDFAGPSAASEPETKAIMKYIMDSRKTENIRTYFTLHSFSQNILYPYGSNEKSDKHKDLDQMASKAVQVIKTCTGRTYESGTISEIVYPASGVSLDWVHKYSDIPVAFSFELRGPRGNPDMFILPAEEIKDASKEILFGMAAILNEASQLDYYL